MEDGAHGETAAFVPAGTRVVRGPDWSWGKQDGGEGHVGTIRTFESAEEVVVVWDNGVAANYRCADACDLRILDTSATGLRHTGLVCHYCGASPVYSTLWRCSECESYDLCSQCYHGDKHNLRHRFLRISWPGSTGLLMESRKRSKKVTIRGAYPGARVVRGIDWQWEDQDGGSGKRGKICEIQDWSADYPKSAAYVLWDAGSKNLYRLGFGGMVDLKCITEAKGGSYYRDHLPLLSRKLNLLYLFSPGERVSVEMDVDLVRSLQMNHGGWTRNMNEIFDQIGTVVCIDDEYDVVVKYPSGNTWTLNPAILRRVAGIDDLGSGVPIRRIGDVEPGSTDLITLEPSTVEADHAVPVLDVGDIVKICMDAEAVRLHVHVHGDRTLGSVVGKEGEVIDIDQSGNVVVDVSGTRWTLHRRFLTKQTLNSTGRERLYASFKRSISTLPIFRLNHSDFARLLVKAAAEGNVAKCGELLSAADVKPDILCDGVTPLKVAIMEGHIPIVKLLISHGCDVELEDENGNRPVHVSARYGRAAAVELLAEAKADINARNGQSNETALHIATASNHVDTVAVLIEMNAYPSLQNSDGDTPLHLAVQMGHEDVIALLAMHKADPSLVNNNGFNVLQLAVSSGVTTFCSSINRPGQPSMPYGGVGLSRDSGPIPARAITSSTKARPSPQPGGPGDQLTLAKSALGAMDGRTDGWTIGQL